MSDDIILSSIVAPDATLNGYSQEELAEQWWRTIIAIPQDQNPIHSDDFDAAGAAGSSEKASLTRLGSIQFLVGSFQSGTYERTITIPGGSSLFIPLINTSWIGADFGTGQLEPSDEAYIEWTRPQVIYAVENMRPIDFQIDGISVPNLLNYQQLSDDITDIGIPASNAFNTNTPVGDGTELETWQLAGGYWLGLLPLSPESHRITFTAISDDPTQEGIEFSLDISYNIDFDLNEINGDRHDNRCSVRGTDGWDEIHGNGGNDYIVGKGGNDALYGDRGNDTLIGVDPNRHHPGRAEIDILWGGEGRDKFVLGDRHHTFYLGQGLADYAIIKDFAKADDVIQLAGCRGSYQLREDYTLGSRTGTAIMRGSCELVAFVDGVTDLSLQSNDFAFVR